MRNARIRVDVKPGVFSSERSVSFQAGGRSYSMLVDESDVHGDTMDVRVIGERNGEVLVDLPRETMHSGKRVVLPKTFLVG